MKSFIYPEMMVHVALCTNKEPKNVLVISDHAQSLEEEIKKHDQIDYKSVSGDLKELEQDFFDVIICEKDFDIAALEQVNRILKNDGQIVMTHPSLDNVEENKKLMQLLGYSFKIIMPFNLGTGNTALLASKEYHPTADIILQRADMLDDLNYYNCDVHLAAFAMPNYIRKEYLGIIKN
jgi:spermidine synthase